MLHPIPGLVRGIDPTIPRQVLESRLKTIDKRRAEIEAALGHGTDDNYQAQELRAEGQALGDMRAEIEAVLNPRQAPKRSPELQKLYDQQREADKLFLRVSIRQRTEQIEHAAQKEEAAGNHRSARLHRLTIPEIPEQVCREFGKDLALLAELEGEANVGGARIPRRRPRSATS
jgi:hypothetical protein